MSANDLATMRHRLPGIMVVCFVAERDAAEILSDGLPVRCAMAMPDAGQFECRLQGNSEFEDSVSKPIEWRMEFTVNKRNNKPFWSRVSEIALPGRICRKQNELNSGF